jgi:hypothetical protein
MPPAFTLCLLSVLLRGASNLRVPQRVASDLPEISDRPLAQLAIVQNLWYITNNYALSEELYFYLSGVLSPVAF